MSVVSVFDTSISDFNLGNQIIMDSVYVELSAIFPKAFFYKLPYIELTRHTFNCIEESNYIFFGGTNSINSRMEKYRQWGINWLTAGRVAGTILMGLGWWRYEGTPSYYTKYVLGKALSRRYAHSVRDGYTKQKLSALGYEVLNTGCPTLWRLDNENLAKIERKKADVAVVTLTDYARDPIRDQHLLDVCSKKYGKIYFWPQGIGDINYVNELKIPHSFEMLDPNLAAYDVFLSGQAVDYVGTRLHAGIRAIQHGHRTYILGIDNRAVEMGRDFGLPVVSLLDLQRLEELIDADYEIQLKLPVDAITMWKSQFN